MSKTENFLKQGGISRFNPRVEQNFPFAVHSKLFDHLKLGKMNGSEIPPPRYKSRACECSVYSCLTQFTAPELLTGNNKWACDRCSKMAAEKRKMNNGKASSSEDAEESEDCGGDGGKKKSGKETVYSNASKQG